MSKSPYLIVAALMLTACQGREDEICKAALDGVSDPLSQTLVECRRVVWRAGFEAQHAAAKKYRDIKR